MTRLITTNFDMSILDILPHVSTFLRNISTQLYFRRELQLWFKMKSDQRILFIEDNHTIDLENCTAIQDVSYLITQACGVVDIRDHRHERATPADLGLGPGADAFGIARRGRAALPKLTIVSISTSRRREGPS